MTHVKVERPPPALGSHVFWQNKIKTSWLYTFRPNGKLNKLSGRGYGDLLLVKLHQIAQIFTLLSFHLKVCLSLSTDTLHFVENLLEFYQDKGNLFFWAIFPFQRPSTRSSADFSFAESCLARVLNRFIGNHNTLIYFYNFVVSKLYNLYNKPYANYVKDINSWIHFVYFWN